MRLGNVRLERNVPCVLRDGVVLYADIYYPEHHENVPVLLMRQPFGKQLAASGVCAHPIWYANQGYMVVVQDVRGRGESDGSFYPFISEAKDGYDAVEWAAKLPGSSGKVGMYGQSYQGMTQWAAASLNPPSLKAIAPAMSPVDCYSGLMYPHGSLALAELRIWSYEFARDSALRAGDKGAAAYCTHMLKTADQWLGQLPLLDQDEVLAQYFPAYYDWVSHPQYDAYWEKLNWFNPDNVVPALHIGAWYDCSLKGVVDGYEHYARYREQQRGHVIDYMIIGPWSHSPSERNRLNTSFSTAIHATPSYKYEKEAYAYSHQAQLQWFNYWLKADTLGSLPCSPIQYYEINSRQWQSVDKIPHEQYLNDGHYKLYLNNSGIPANGLFGNGTLSTTLLEQVTTPDIFVYDSKVPTFCPSYFPIDRQSYQQSCNMLVYTSEPAEAPIKLLGFPKLYLKYQTVSGPTDIVALLTVVYPDGTSAMLSAGREEIHSEYSKENETSEICLTMRLVGIELQPGMALRLELTGSAFPLFVRHMNGVRINEQLTLGHDHLNIATTAIYSHDAQCYLSIPLLDNSSISTLAQQQISTPTLTANGATPSLIANQFVLTTTTSDS